MINIQFLIVCLIVTNFSRTLGTLRFKKKGGYLRGTSVNIDNGIISFKAEVFSVEEGPNSSKIISLSVISESLIQEK
jgi:hypothetical protein